MFLPTIDREEPLQLFRHMLKSEAPFRVLQLLGEQYMGKTHLLTQIFPKVAKDQRIRYAFLDLRSQNPIGIQLFHQLCQQLRPARFIQFDQACQKWLNKPRIEITGFRAFFSRTSINSHPDDSNERLLSYLTLPLVDDINQLNDQALLLIFDHVDDPATQHWLMYDLLVHLHTIENLRIVIAGRNLPNAAGSYNSDCKRYVLPPVTKDGYYIQYCRELGSNLLKRVITFRAYLPILFVPIFCQSRW